MTYDEFATARLQPLLRYATMLTGDPHLAADLVQEVMVRVQLKWRRVVGADVPELYVRRMLTNAYVDWRRTSWWRRNTLWARPGGRADRRRWRPTTPSHAADRDEVWTLIRALPHRQRAALVLRFYEDLSDAEIAEVLDCAVGTVAIADLPRPGHPAIALAARRPTIHWRHCHDRGRDPAGLRPARAPGARRRRRSGRSIDAPPPVGGGSGGGC